MQRSKVGITTNKPNVIGYLANLIIIQVWIFLLQKLNEIIHVENFLFVGPGDSISEQILPAFGFEEGYQCVLEIAFDEVAV